MGAMTSVAAWFPPGRAAAAPSVELSRRGVRHGRVRSASAAAPPDLESRGVRTSVAADWSAARPIHLPGVLTSGLRTRGGAIRASLALFDRLRRGASFQDALWKRLESNADFEPAGVTVDLGDEREIEKVFADLRRGGRLAGRDLYAKLSWISHDERDESLRIRFSFGSEQLFEWQHETRRAPLAERLADAVFPECSLLTEHEALVRLVTRACGRAVRFSERIVYNNAPGGGAIFHHDVEPHQLGVLYGQFAGETGWLALPKLELAAELSDYLKSSGGSRRTPRAALRWLETEDDPRLLELLNHTPGFTRRLVERGHFVHLRRGDALLLPSPSEERVCWHSVFALGSQPSLAHSYGIFGRRRTDVRNQVRFDG
jgi:hypothetical protein